MDKFVALKAIAAPLPLENVDTDMIIPQKFLKTIGKSGLGVNAFYNLRYHGNGMPKEDFVLNIRPYQQAEILITGANFGCGSSREHAPWALKDFGIKVIIASHFADIFYGNCFKNGLLPIVLPDDIVKHLMYQVQDKAAAVLSVNLQHQIITDVAGRDISFDIDPFRKHCLLNGLDEIGLTLEQAQDIEQFEKMQRTHQPWLYQN
ncbi:3-isopropylmalate dehydratase small subunit [Luteithermobacter gelatinilyticus]|uniref:3-isopropylmalate dehydratase small subunit n=1 Tax=Luteithermobacter gelatinilyticus TaxID=2582913 RepID=UPI00110601B7|nr:3-isopropylmalate dehydratase small subunit [Luteithermobacter gelatinilyticus]